MNAMLKRWLSVIAGFAVVAAGTFCSAQGGTKTAWVGTWAASPMKTDNGFTMRPFTLTTVRQIVHISNGGDQVRIRLTNAYGMDSLAISDVHLAVSAGGPAIKDGTDHTVTFGGAASIRLAPGAEIYSDPVPLAVAPLSDLAISIFFPNQVMRAETYHQLGLQTNYQVNGDQSGASTLNDAVKINSWYFLDGVDVPAVEGSRAIVTVGDSITDGALSTPDTNQRWPDLLAARLKQEHGLENVAVLNQGISGNRVLNENAGPSAVARIDRDILAQNGVKYVIVLDSINDIGRLASRIITPEDVITAADLEYGLSQLADAAHEHGIKIYGATLTPYVGAGYSSDKGEQIREAVNDWIRTSGVFDGVVDFDKITQDPANPTKFNPAYDSGDHLHPNDAGYKAMADGIDLKLFAK
jgi:lysophospholipase L1-like esterase